MSEYAFQSASNWGNLPNGAFSPQIYSRKVQKQFRKSSVVEGITNSDYFGEIANMGDSVKILKEPEITVAPYGRGTQIVAQDLIDNDFVLTIDQANYFAFRMDDIEVKQASVSWEELASDRAAYRLRDHYDRDVLGYMSGYEWDVTAGLWKPRTSHPGTLAEATADVDELLSRNKLDRTDFVQGASAGESIVMGVDGTYDATPLQILNRMKRKLDELNVDQEGRWVVVDPVFVEKLMDENSKLVQTDWNRGEGEGLQNGQLSTKKIRGFRIYESNNLPYEGNGADFIAPTGSTTNFGVIVAGHDCAVATATQLTKTEKQRSTDFFGDVVRGMQLYGRKVLKPEALLRANYNING